MAQDAQRVSWVSDSIMLSGLKLLREYPKHDKVEELTAHLDGWENLLD